MARSASSAAFCSTGFFRRAWLGLKLQAVDAELGQVERLLKMDSSGAAGNCPSCDALYGRGAVFCWQCGHALLPVEAGA